jgi:pyridoxine kinase
MRVLAISSQVAFGPVGNSASVPALNAAGIEVIALPTIMLSNQPALGTPSGLRVPAETLGAMLDKLEALGALENLSAILTGYFADAEQVITVAKIIARLKPALYLCDPVIGDDPKGLYVPEAVAQAIRDHLVPLATIITPNRFEREWLMTKKGITAHIPERITTSLPQGATLVTELVAAGQTYRHATLRQKQVPHGTGDLFSGLYLAARVQGQMPQAAFEDAMMRLEKVIDLSIGKPGLDLLRGLS